MADALFDTNILIDYLLGIEAARETIKRYASPAISIVTWMEVLVGAADEEEEAAIHPFLDRFERLDISGTIALRAVRLRRAQHIRLPDAIIWATAQIAGCPLITRDTKAFPRDAEGIILPYRR